MNVLMIPANSTGDKLFLRNFTVNAKGNMYIEYKSTYNDIPFTKTQIFAVDDNFVIVGDDGTVVWRFPIETTLKLIDHEDTVENEGQFSEDIAIR